MIAGLRLKRKVIRLIHILIPLHKPVHNDRSLSRARNQRIGVHSAQDFTIVAPIGQSGVRPAEANTGPLEHIIQFEILWTILPGGSHGIGIHSRVRRAYIDGAVADFAALPELLRDVLTGHLKRVDIAGGKWGL